MNGKQVKLLRGQIRQIVKEQLPEILGQEFAVSMHKDLASVVSNRLEQINKAVKDTLDQVDSRSKNIQDYILRNTGTNVVPAPSTTVEPSAPIEKT